MEASEVQMITRWARDLATPVKFKAVLAADEQGRHLRAFCETIAELSIHLSVQYQEVGDDSESFLRLAPNVVYQAVPTGPELPPFLAALDGSVAGPSGLAAGALDRICEPVNLDVYITRQCGFCPQVVASLLGLAGQCDRIQLNIIDGLLFADKARQRAIQSVPTLLLNDEFRWTGQVALQEVVEVAVDLAAADFGVDTLRAMVEGGNAAEVARMVLERGKIYPALLELFVHEKWSVRLGAMVVFEYLNDSSEELAAELVALLGGVFDQAPEAAQGDILHVFAESGRWDARQKIQQVLAAGRASEAGLAAAQESLANWTGPSPPDRD